MAQKAKSQGGSRIRWSEDLAYAVGLLVTDGSLSKDGRHILLTSKDREQLINFLEALRKSQTKMSRTQSGYTGKYVPRVQFSDIRLYRFLLTIGLMPGKTKIVNKIRVPKKYFYDFLRGHHDGDGYFYSYFDPRWPKSFLYYLGFTSASRRHIDWLRSELKTLLGVWGHLTKDQKKTTYQLKYAKKEAYKILKRMYGNKQGYCLTRKRLKIIRALSTIGQQL